MLTLQKSAINFVRNENNKMYDFRIIKNEYSGGVTIIGFPEVHYGMDIESLKKLKKVIDDYLLKLIEEN